MENTNLSKQVDRTKKEINNSLITAEGTMGDLIQEIENKETEIQELNEEIYELKEKIRELTK